MKILNPNDFFLKFQNCSFENNVMKLMPKTSLLQTFGQVFDFRGDADEEKFDFFYRYCQSHLDEYSKIYNFHPAYLYIAQNEYFNSVAQPKTNVIAISKEVIKQLKNFFWDNLDFENDQSLINFRDINKWLLAECNKSLNQFVFEFASFFSYYHELAHLMQEAEYKALGNTTSLNEYGYTNSNFNVEHHLREIDSDFFAANQVAYHVLSLYEDAKIFFNEVENEILYNIIMLSMASIFAYRIRHFRGLEDIYYYERSHPHSAIRIIIISKVFLSFLSKHSKNLTPDEQQILIGNSLGFADKIAGVNYSSRFSDLIKNGNDKIAEYWDYMSNESPKYSYLLTGRI
ncbi:hypothetical protein [Emticicia sp. 17c]|uniref:hypothetical protein n=1 Tax=Emticicia sp. 17c TaxID=3127704 RepID=UPI00301BC294